MSVTLAEIIEDKKVVETTVKKLLNELEKKSGCKVSGVYLDFSQTIGQAVPVVRDVEVKVELPKR